MRYELNLNLNDELETCYNGDDENKERIGRSASNFNNRSPKQS